MKICLSFLASGFHYSSQSYRTFQTLAPWFMCPGPTKQEKLTLQLYILGMAYRLWGKQKRKENVISLCLKPAPSPATHVPGIKFSELSST